jgi:hypothetical protein
MAVAAIGGGYYLTARREISEAMHAIEEAAAHPEPPAR